jgi:hypothetical protein
MFRLAAAAVSGFALLAVGCVDDSSSSLTYGTITLLSVDPAAFVGSVRCGTPELRTYVVSLYDVTTGGRQRVATSGATSCTTSTSFGTPIVAEERFYVADIDGYDRDDIVVSAQTDPDSGHPIVFDTANHEPVPARWTAACGEAPWITDATTSSDGGLSRVRFLTKTSRSLEVVVHPCLPFRSTAPSDGGASSGPPDGAAPDGPNDDATGDDISLVPPVDGGVVDVGAADAGAGDAGAGNAGDANAADAGDAR